MASKINLNTFAEGALLERANQAILAVLENIADPNTDHKVQKESYHRTYLCNR